MSWERRHLRSGAAIDLLASPEGKVTRFVSPRIRNIVPHGTGCTYSAAIAGKDWPEASGCPPPLRWGKNLLPSRWKQRVENRRV